MHKRPDSYTMAEGFMLTMIPEDFRYVPSYTLSLTGPDGSPIATWEGFCPPSDRPHDCAQAWLDAWTFITMQEGDVEPEYWDGWTPAQLAFARHHGSACYEAIMAGHLPWYASHPDLMIRSARFTGRPMNLVWTGENWTEAANV